MSSSRSVRHETKVTHYFSPSEEHLREFLGSVRKLYKEQTHTDLRIVARDGAFAIHQMVLASRSSFLKELIIRGPGDGPCPCENLTIHLPDFKAVTVNNLISLLYTGRSLGNCSTDDLKSLISFLKIDIKRLESDEESRERKHVPSRNYDVTSTDSPAHTNGSGRDSLADEEEDEVLEVTPSIQSFMGNHFLAGDEEDEMVGDDVDDEEEEEDCRESCTPTSNNGENGEKFICRLCGKASSNGASLFAHLLYPHYAHLWRSEIPHRANRYECKKCTYQTNKRQHFVMHVARVHDELRKKLSDLGENLAVLDNLTAKPSSNCAEKIVSNVAKYVLANSETPEYFNASSTAEQPEEHVRSEESEESRAERLASTILQFQQHQQLLANGPFLPSAPTRLPRGYKPFVKCRLCGKAWKGKDNFFTHLVSTHFKYLWANEVPRHAEMFHCKVQDCNYQSKYRYNFLFHLAGKHKQLKQKLSDEGVPLEVLTPLETDGSEFETALDSPESIRNKLLNSSLPTSSSSSFNNGVLPTESNTKLICRVCSKVSLNHTCHRQHVVGKHFQHFWAHYTADSMGIFNCPHRDCPYKTPNRSVFVIHLAYVHQELKLKIAESGRDPTIILPDVFGKRKYRRSSFGLGQHQLPSLTRAPMNISVAAMAAAVEAANAVRIAAVVSAAASSGNDNSTSSVVPNNNNNEDPPPPPAPQSSTPSASVKKKNPRIIGYRCLVCKAEFSRSRGVIEHLALSHFLDLWESRVGPTGPYSCGDCDYRTTSRTTYISHLTTAHDGLKRLLDMREMKIDVLYERVFGSEEDDDEDEPLEDEDMIISGDLEDVIDEGMEEDDFGEEEDADSILSFQ